MTIASQTSRFAYTGDGLTTAFSIPFYFAAQVDIIIYLQNAAGVSTIQVLGSDYTLVGETLSAGGTATFAVAPTSGYTVIIYRDPALTQTTSYNNNDPFPAKSHELALDKGLTIDQRTRELVRRSIHLADGEQSMTTELAPIATRASTLLGFDANGNIEYSEVTPGTRTLPITENFAWSGALGVNNSTRTNSDRWSDRVSIEEFRANGDGITDDYSAMMRAHDYLKRNGATGPGGTIHLRPDKRYLMNSTPVFTRGVSIDGGVQHPSNMMNTATNLMYYATQGGLVVGSAGVGLQMTSSCALTNTLVMRAGMTFPVADESLFSGLGVEFTSGANGGLVENCMFLGLNRAILTSDGAQHRFRNINIDCTNGIAILNALDVCYVDNVHCWPFTDSLLGTQAQQAVIAQRSGIGLLLSTGDWHQVKNFFTFTYDIGVQVTSANSCTIQSQHDNNTLSTNTHQIGVYISGTTTEANLTNTNVAGAKHGIVVDRAVDADTHKYTTAMINSPRIWSATTAGILVSSGNTNIRGAGVIRNTVNAIIDNDPDANVTVSGIAPLALTGSFYSIGVAKTTGVAKQYGNDLEKLVGAAPFGGAGAATGKSATQMVSISPTEGIGYATGSGGVVTQLTNKATTVILNRASGAIVMNAANLLANTNVTFTLTNSIIEGTDVILLNYSGTAGAYTLNARCSAGFALIDVFNNTAGPLAEAVVISFTVIKGAWA